MALAALVWAEDLSNGQTICKTHYPDSNLDKYETCLDGYSFRIESGGPFSFIDCHRKCDKKYIDPLTAAPCHFACSIPEPGTSIFSMHYVDNGNGKPETTVVKSGVFENMPLENIFGQDVFKTNLFSSIDNAKIAESDDFNSFHHRLDAMFDNFRKEFFKKLRSDMNTESRGHIQTSRPHGHDGFGMEGKFVGNVLADGSSVIRSHPITNVADDTWINEEAQRRRHNEDKRFISLMFICLAFVCFGVLLIVALFVRIKESRWKKKYVQERAPKTTSKPNYSYMDSSATSKKPLPVEKAPFNEDYETASGVPPPSYSSLSLYPNEKK